MKSLRRFRTPLSWLMLVILATWQITLPLQGATCYWDADANANGNNSTTGLGLGGNGIWNTTNVNWWDGVSLTGDTAYTFTSSDTAVFTGSGGVIQLGTSTTVGSIIFNQIPATSPFIITGDGTSATQLTLAGGSVAVNVAGTDIINTILAGTNGLNMSSTTTGTLSLTNTANTFSGGITISSGTLAAFSEGSLGAASNTITFNGSTLAAGLTLGSPTVLNANRTITLNNTGGTTATLTATGAAQDVILGKVTGAGTFAIANGGTTYLLNSNNDYSGVLWAQTGLVSVNVLPDDPGDGNIKLGSSGSTGGLQWGAGATTPLNLTNRAIELAGTTGGGTIDSSANGAANAVTINNLIFTTASSGNKTLTLTGLNTGTNTFAANITNNGTSTTGLTKSGMDLWVLAGTGNNYTGALTINQGMLRVINASGLGGTGSFSFGGASNGQGIDLRSDAAPTGIRSLTNNSANNAVIFLDHAAVAGNTTTGQTITFGTIAQGNSTASITFVGDHGYGVALGLNTLAASNGTAGSVSTYTITSDLGSPGLIGYSVGSAEFITIAGFNESGSNTGGVTGTMNGWGNFILAGPISNTSTQPVNITKSGLGVLTYSPTLLTGWNTGTLTIGGGTTRITSSIAAAGATLTFGGGLLDLRNDASTNIGLNVANVSANSTLFIDHSLGGNTSGQTVTIGNMALNNSATLNVVGDHGYSLVAGNITQKGTVTTVIGNYLGAPGYVGYTGGTITLGNITTDATAGAATLTLAGFGDFILNGTISSSNAGVSMNITKTNLGVVTFAGNNSAWTSTTQGTLTTSGGTTLIDVTNTNAIGSANLTGTAGMVEILGATGTSGAPWTTKNLAIGGAFTLAVDPLAGSSATGQTVNLGGLTGGNTMIINSDHGYSVTFNGAGTTAANTALTNAGNGLVTLGGGLTSTTSSTWTLGGPGDFLVSGNITNGAVTTSFTKSGPGTTTLSGTNTIGGNVVLSGGILRVTNAGAFGGAGGITAQGGNSNSVGSMAFDFRSDTSMDLLRGASSAGGYNYAINVDRAIGGSGSNQTISLGGGTWAGATGTGWGFTVTGANGYSLQYKGTAFTMNGTFAAPTINNLIPDIAGNGSIIFAGGLSFTTTVATGIILSGTGDYLISGAITSQAGTTVVSTITKNGTGALTISNDNSASWNSVANDEVITSSAGILRLTNGGGLGGPNALFNLNGGLFDLRSDAGITQAGPVVTVGATATINVDRGVGGVGTGGTQTITSLKDNGVFTVFATGGTQSGANAYNLAVTTFTVGGVATAAVPTLVNNISNGGAVNIGTLTGANVATLINGSGSTNIATALTLGTGTLTKSGVGTLTLAGPAGYAATNTHGSVTVNGGTLALDFSGITTPSNLLQSTAGLTLGAASAGGVSGGTLSIKGAASGATSQTLATLAVQSGSDQITLNANGGASTTLTFTGATTATNAGGQLLITAPTNTSVVFNSALNASTAQGRNLVFFDGANYDWATNSGANTAVSALTVSTALPLSGATSTTNYLVNAPTTTQSASQTGNSIKIDSTANAVALNLGATTLTLTQGGILFVGTNAATITGTSATTGLKSATATASDLVINNYGTGTLTIQAPIIQGTGTSTLTIGGTGTTVMGNSSVLATLGTYTGITYINGGTVQLASGITGLGAAASNTALTQNGGTFDLNGNNVNIGAFNGGPAAVIDNTSASAASLTIGAGNGTGTFDGIIKNTGGALTLIKAGTGTITLGDAVTGGSSLFTGNLKFTGASTLNINSLADAPGSKVDFSVSGANLTFIGRNNLVLNNRVLDISAASGSATITSSSVGGSINGTNAVMTIGSAFSPTGTGALSLTLTGSAGNVANGGTGTGAGDGVSGISGTGNVAVVNAFNGAIGDGAGILSLTVAGAGGWSLGGNNTYSGGTTLSSTGLVRATSATAFGSGTVNVTGTPIVDLRSDSSLTFGNNFTMNGSFTINVDRAIGGTGYGQIMNIGTVTEATTGKSLTITNVAGATLQTGSGVVDGYGLHMAGLVLNAGTATTIQNAMGSPGSAEFVIPTAATGVAGALVIDGITTAGNLTAHTLTIGGGSNNFAVTIINGDITQGTGTTLGITLAGSGSTNFITLAGQTSATNFSGGINMGPNAGSTVRATTAFSLGTGAITFAGVSTSAGSNGGTLEVRNDSSVTYTNNIILNATGSAGTARLNVGGALNGNSGRNNTFTFGQVVFQGITGNALTISGIGGSNDNSGDSVTFANGVNVNLSGTVGFTVTNNLLLPGVLNLGNITNAGTTGTQTLTIAGGTGLTIVGDITNGTGGATGITYSGTGILDLTRMTAATNFTGGLTFSGGTTRVANLAGLASTSIGGASNILVFNGAQLELRSDVDVTYSNPMQLAATGSAPGTGSGINIGQLADGSGANSGVTYTFSGGFKATGVGKTFTINGIGGLGAGAASLASNGDSVAFTGGIDLNGTTGGTTTIVNNLPLPGTVSLGNVTSSTTGAATLSVGGSGVTTVGDVTNGSGTVTLTTTGSGIVDLSRMTAATNYSGGFVQNGSGITRVTNTYDFGTAAAISLQNGTIEIRSDSNFTYTGALNWNSNNGSVAISVGEVGTGTTTGVGSTFSFGALTVTNASGKTLTFGGIGNTSASSGDSVVVNGVTFGAGGLSNTISNNLSLPGTLSLGNVTGAATSGTVTLTIGGTGFTTVGTISNGVGGGVVAMTYSGTGILQINNLAGSNFSGGFTLNGSGGTLDLRSATDLTFSNALTVATNSPTINFDQPTSGNFSKTLTFSGATTVLSTTGKTLTLTGGSGYSMVFTNGFNETTTGAAQTYSIINNVSGSANLGAINFANSTTSNSLVLGGSGYTIVGNLTGAAAINTLTYSGTGFLDLTGNNAASNQVTGVVLSGAGGVVKVSSAANLGVANDTVQFTNATANTLQVRSDNGGTSNGTINFGNTIALNVSGAQAVIDVGNTGSSSVTGNTVAFGALTNNTTASVAAQLTVNGNNGYGVSFTSFAMSNGTGNNNTIVANAPVTILGNVTNNETGFSTSNFDTLFLDGVVGGSVQGVISDSATGSITLGGYTKVTKNGTGTWTLSGNSTYTGQTTVNSGVLLISNTAGSGTGTGAVTVNGSANNNVFGTLGGTGTISGTLTLATGGATSFASGPALNPGSIGTAGTLTVGGLLTTNNFSKLNFDLNTATTVGGGVNDLISAATLPVIGATTQVNINTLGVLTLGSTYTLMNGYSGSIASPGNFALNSVFTGVDTTHSGVLVSSAGQLQLLVTNQLSTAYWSGAVDGTWNTINPSTLVTNWRTDATSNIDTNGVPGATTDVHFVTTTPAAANFTTTLGQAFTIKTLSFDSSSTSAISIAGNTLTIAPSNSATGITIDAAAGPVTISSGLGLGAAQTWTNNSTTNPLSVTGVISGGGSLAIINGTVAINQQANTFTGNITLDGANTVLSIVGNSGGTYTTSSPLGNSLPGGTNFKTVTLTNGATFRLASQNYNVNVISSTNVGAGQVFIIGTGGGIFDVPTGSTLTIDDGSVIGTGTTAYELQGSGDLTKTSGGTMTLRNQNSYSGTLTVAAGTLKASGTTMATSAAGIVVQSGAALDLSGQTMTDTETMTVSGTGLAATPAGVITNSSATAASIQGAVILAGDSNIGGTGAITLSGAFSETGGSRSLTKVGAGTLTLSNVNNNYSGVLTINSGTLSVAALANSGVGDNGTGNIVFNNGSSASALTYTGSGTGTLSSRGLTLQGSTGSVAINSNGTGPLVFGATNIVNITGTTTLTLSAVAASGANSIAGGLSDGTGTLSLVKSGAGNWTLAGANSFTGNVTINSGNPGALIITDSTSLGVGNKTVSIIDNTAGNSASIQLDGSGGNITLGSNISWTTSSVTGIGGLVNLAGDNVINGNFTLTSGGGGTQFTSNGGSLTLTGTFTPNTTSRQVVLNGTSSGTVSGLMQDGSTTNTLQLVKLGTGTWNITGANTLSNGTLLQSGALRLAGGDNRLLSTGGGAVVLGSGTTSGKLIIGGDANGNPGTDPTPGNQHSQTFTQTTATSILSTSGTGTTNAVVGGAAGGTSAGTPANNSVLTLKINSGFTDTYAGFIGGAGAFENNINLVKSGGGTLVLSADLSAWTGLMNDAGPNMTNTTTDPTRPEIDLTGGVLRLTNTAVINTVIRNSGGVIDDQGATYGNNYFLITTGGLIALSQTTDSFSNSGITATSHGVAALNIAGNTGVTDYANSDMYLGAIGARIFSNATLTVGTGNTYRLGGGAPWQNLGAAAIGGSGGYLQIATANVITGNNNVVIGDNGSYNGDSGLFGSNSSVEFTAAQNYTGTTTLAGGSLIVSNANQLGNPTTAAGSIILDGGILRYSGITTDFSNRITIDSGGTIDTNGQIVTFATGLGNSDTGTSDAVSSPSTNGVGGLTKIGTGTLILTGNSTYTGATVVGGGTLQLNRQTGSLNTNSALTFVGNGTFRFDNTGAGGSLSQNLGALTFSAGDGVILSQRTAAQSTTLTFASLARTSGATGNFTVAGSGSSASVNQVKFTSAPTASQFIDPGIYFGGTDFAVYDAAGFIRAFAYGTDKDSTGTVLSVTQTAATTLAAGATGADVNLTGALSAQTAATIESLKIAGANAITFAAAGNILTINSGGIIKTGATANFGSAAGNGIVQAGPTGTGELVVRLDASGDALLMNSSIVAGALTKSGLGTLTLATANTITGQITVNGGGLTLSAQNQYGTTTGFTLNGGTLTWNTAGTALPKLFTIGLQGGSINSNGGGNTAVGTAGDYLGFAGLGARTLNLTTGVTDRRTDFLFNIGDNGGPTSLVIGSLTGAANQSVVRLSGINSYTGTTTITLGALELNSATALPGGLGGTTPTSANTGGGNLIFNGGIATNHAILGLSTASGDFMRGLGSGFDQVQFLGNGGFGNISGGTTRVVNLGGTGASITWGSTFFFPTGGQLEFGHSNTNVPEAGAIDFQNGLAFGGTTARIIDVQDDNQSAGSDGADVIMSGNLTNTAAAASLTKTGTGVMKLTGDNSSGTAANTATTVNAGYVVFANTSNPLNAILGSGANNRTVTVASGAGVVLAGATAGGTIDFNALLNRLVTTSAGSVMLDTSSFDTQANIDLSQFATLTLGAYSNQGGTPIYYAGSITPNGTTYRLAAPTELAKGGQGAAAGAVQRNTNLLVLTKQNVLTGSNSLVSGNGTVYLTNTNNFSGGTTESGAQANIGIGNDAAMGTGLITISNATSFIGSIDGDHYLSNNIKTSATGNFVVTGTTSADGMANPGTFIFLGNLNVATTQSLFARGNNPVFIGDIAPQTTSVVSLQANTGSGSFSLLTTPAGAINKTFNSLVFAGANDVLVIDSDRSLGAVPGAPATDVTFNAAGTIKVQPGTSSVTLNQNRNIVVASTITAAFDVSGGTIGITGVTTGGLNINSTLILPDLITTGGVNSFQKTGLGTLVLQNTNTFTATGTNGFQIFGGTLQLDYANLVGAGPILNNATTMQLTLGTSTNSTYSNGGTLYISNGANAATQNFTTTVTTAKDNFIKLDSTGGVITLGLGTNITRVVGGTVNFTGNALGTSVINSAFAPVNGILPGATWNGNNLVAASGSALSQYSAYTALTGNTIVSATATNVKVDNATTGNVTLAATGVININTLTFFDTLARTIDVRNGTTAGTLNFGTVGTILAGSGTGALTIGVSGTAGTINAGGPTTSSSGELIFINNSNNTMTVNSVIQNNTGTGAITTVVKSGSGVVTLAGANTYTGSLFINNGVLAYSDASAVAKNLGSATVAANNIIMNGGALRYTGTGANTNIFGVTFNTISAIDVSSSTGVMTMGTTTALSGTTGILGVVGIMQKTGSGSLTLAGNVANTNLSIEVVSGTLTLGKAAVVAVDQAAGASLVVDSGATAKLGGSGGNQIGDSSSVVVKTGGVFDLNGFNEGFDGLAGGGSVTNNATGTATLTLGLNQDANISANTVAAANAGVASTGLNNFSGVISDGGAGKVVALTKGGAGTQILSGVSTYSGATTINSGTLKLAVANALPAGAGKGDVTIVGNTVVNGLIVPGTLDIGGFNQSINGLNSTTGGYVTNTVPLSFTAGNWTATAATNTLTVGNNNATASFNGIMQDGLTIIPNPGTGAATSAVGTFAMTKTGSGTQTLSGANTATGALTVNQGEVDLNTTGANAWSGNATANTGGTLKLLQSNQIADSKTVTAAGGTFNLNGKSETVGGASLTNNGSIADTAGGGALTSTTAYDLQSGSVSAVLAGTAGATKSTGGTVTLSAVNTYTGTTAVNAGTLSVVGATGSLGGTTITVANSATFNTQGSTNIGTATLGSLSINSGGTLSFADNAISATSLSLLNTASGSLTMNGGSFLTVDLSGSTGGLNAVDSGSVISLILSGGNATVNLNVLGATGTLTNGTYTLLTYASGSTLNGNDFTWDGTNTVLAIGGGRSYTLNTTSTALQLVVQNSGPLSKAYWTNAQGTNSWATLTGSSATNWSTDAAGTLDAQQLPGGGTTDVIFTASNAATPLTTTLDGSYSINSLTFQGTSPTNTNVVTINNGTGTNTLTIGAGGITVQSGNAGATINVNLALSAGQTWTNDSSNTLLVAGSTITGTGTSLIVAGSGNTTISAAIQTGVGSLTKNGLGTLALNGNNTYTGGTVINGGTVQINSASSLGATSGSATINDATLEATQSIISSRNFVVGSANSAIAVDSGMTYTLNGVISGAGAGSLTKNGAGNLIVTGTNTYTGTTTVNAGLLQVGTVSTTNATAGGVGAGQVTVNASGTLAGTGTVRGSTVIQGVVTNSGPTQSVTLGVFAPGDSTSVNTRSNFNVAGNLTVGTGGQLKLELGTPTAITTAYSGGVYKDGSNNTYANAAAYLAGGGAGDLATWNAAPTNGNSDYINVTGSLTLGNRQDPNQTPTSGFGTVNILGSGYTGHFGDVFNLLDWSGALQGSFTSGPSFSTGGVSGDLDLPTLTGGLSFDTSAFTAYGIVVVVPEPGRVMLLLLGLFSLVLRRRRRQTV